jgi:hypothetical protein
VERIQIAHDRIRAAAKQIKSAGDGRALDQITFDVGLDTLAGKGLANAKVQVRLTLPASTVLGADAKPGYLAGYGWLPAQRALKLAVQKEAVWQRILTDPSLDTRWMWGGASTGRRRRCGIISKLSTRPALVRDA